MHNLIILTPKYHIYKKLISQYEKNDKLCEKGLNNYHY